MEMLYLIMARPLRQSYASYYVPQRFGQVFSPQLNETAARTQGQHGGESAEIIVC